MLMFRRNKYLIILFIILLLVGIGIRIGTVKSSKKLPESKPKDFNFIFNYGIGGKNQLDTVAGKFTQDMVIDPSITTDLELSEEEMDAIYSEMKSISILNYPNNFKPFTMSKRSSFITYSIKITVDGIEKTISWKDKDLSSDDDAVKLRNLFNKIQDIIYSKEEYKKLPNPRGAYM